MGSDLKMKALTLLSITLFYGCIWTEAQKCNLLGQWKNTLGSNMTIESVSQNGEFTGTYFTAVSLTNSTILKSPLTGYQKISEQPTFGFTVNWTFSDSITVWAGQCFGNEKGKEILLTTWLLRSSQKTEQDNWIGTRVGADTFTRLTKSKSHKELDLL
ncbi:avidin-like [Xenopus laevis]|uniref:Avidin-like n=1 Tax=Xenopus laevis TaxID=8355 RepID=A0A8J1L6G5_XENLA|nr:avidin-like [Xenopus laevis]XP_041424534.1 avidin-like [Xenopus laevis]